MEKEPPPGWTALILVAVIFAAPGQPLSGSPPHPSKPVVIPVQDPRAHLTPEHLSQLRFKPTVGLVQLSEGHEAHFNCSIDIPNERLEPTIIWVKDGQDLAGNTLMAIKDLQMSTNGVTTHLSEISISRVQLTDAGEYRCRLAIGPRLVESQPIILEVEEDQNVTRGAPFTLTCEAVGSPGPIKIRWLRDGLPSNVSYDSPSSLLVSGELDDQLIT
ncbi:unnamed protein product [Tetraodon nigroviridis]|uniref:(spotted green pufferfish) hypothetical protein n=1 Tax=Tetraodon nigroviridis TaxID=99883 RepID=Q4RQ49_TETNG|nr:unnamed protein product [Tetraodon nigroviridis]